MTRRLVFVHTIPSIVDLFTRLSGEILPPDVETWHVADEILLKVVLAQGGLSPFIHERVASHVLAAQQAGANAVQLTCSSISPCADTASGQVRIPVLKIDEPMVGPRPDARRSDRRGGDGADHAAPDERSLAARSRRWDETCSSTPRLAEGAYAALFGGDPRAMMPSCGRRFRTWRRAAMSSCWPRLPWRAWQTACPPGRSAARCSPARGWRSSAPRRVLGESAA